MEAHTIKTEEFFIADVPYYESIGCEIQVFQTTFKLKQPVLLKGPTGCGKTHNLKRSGMDESASTHLLLSAAKLTAADDTPVTACHTVITEALTNDAEMLAAINELSVPLI